MTTTYGDVFSAERAIVAAGAWSHRLGAMIGDRIPLETERGYHVKFRNARLSLDRPVTDLSAAVAVVPLTNSVRSTGTEEFAGL